MECGADDALPGVCPANGYLEDNGARSSKPALDLFAALFADLPLNEIVHSTGLGIIPFSRNFEIVGVPVRHIGKDN
jgi:hypothetical protein